MNNNTVEKQEEKINELDSQSNTFSDHWTEYLKKPELVELELNDANQKATEMIQTIQNEIKEWTRLIFGQNRLLFTANEEMITKNTIGELASHFDPLIFNELNKITCKEFSQENLNKQYLRNRITLKKDFKTL